MDKWDLKEGDDADVFMEQMVSDPSIQKVLIICDKMYSEKSDKRKGGAGTEAQIISRRVYEQQSNENKFVVAAFQVSLTCQFTMVRVSILTSPIRTSMHRSLRNLFDGYITSLCL